MVRLTLAFTSLLLHSPATLWEFATEHRLQLPLYRGSRLNAMSFVYNTSLTVGPTCTVWSVSFYLWSHGLYHTFTSGTNKSNWLNFKQPIQFNVNTFIKVPAVGSGIKDGQILFTVVSVKSGDLGVDQSGLERLKLWMWEFRMSSIGSEMIISVTGYIWEKMLIILTPPDTKLILYNLFIYHSLLFLALSFSLCSSSYYFYKSHFT